MPLSSFVPPSPTGGPHRLVLAGGGHAHLQVLQALAMHRPAGLSVTLVSPTRWQHYSGMLPGWMQGVYDLADCRIDLRPLAVQAGAHLIECPAVALEAGSRRLHLADGRHLDYELLSLDIGSEIDTRSLLALGERLLPIKPLDAFSQAWQRLREQAARQGGLRLVVVGGGAAGVEAALAAAAALPRQRPDSGVWLVAGPQGVLPSHGRAVRQRMMQALARSGVQVVAQRAHGTPDGVQLDDGREWPADAVIAATGARPAAWLVGSGLALDARGYVAVDGHHRSRSHAEVFAVGDVCARTDRPLARSGVHAVRAGPVLAHNLMARLGQPPLRTYRPRRWSLYLLAIGRGEAVASWGPFSAAGRWVWRLKDRIDRRFMARFQAAAPHPPDPPQAVDDETGPDAVSPTPCATTNPDRPRPHT